MTTDIRSILIHLDGPERARERLLLGKRLAAEHGASLRVHQAAVPPAAFAPLAGDSAALVLETLLAAEEDRRKKAREVFDDILRQPGVRASWSEDVDPVPERGVARAAMYSDLLVLGQHDPSHAHLGSHFVDAVLMRSGRPAIVLPSVGPVPDGFSTVAIAWKETAEAARAVSAALPLLRRASAVHILSWTTDAAGNHMRSLAGYLALHGIRSESHDEGEEGRDIGEQILSRCADLSADLLVMGCYGHGQAREWVLGGASRTLLQSMTLPVLMAH
jgi:nucleotide-binding universal stress UspA family protein